jgi:16S rRNA (guanine1207-N2)-methyltransferase
VNHRQPGAAAEHRAWETKTVETGGVRLQVVSRAGAPGHGGLEPAVGLLLDHLEVHPGDRLLDLTCGVGLVSAYAGRVAAGVEVHPFDRHLLAVQATDRTLAANAVQGRATFAPAPPPGDIADATVATIRLPQGRLPTLHALWSACHALRAGGLCYVAGANDEGIRTAIRQMEEIFGAAAVLGYRGGNRVAVARRPEHPPPVPADFPWLDPERFLHFHAPTPDGAIEIFSRPGVFSWDRLDAGSAALIETMRVRPGEDILELGCGYGVVGIAAALRSGSGRATLVDVDAEALRCARRSADAAGLQERVEVIPSDAGAALTDRRFDLVVSNPPFHLGKGTNLDIPARFIRDAAAVLRPGGRLYLVANRTLPYERWLQDAFGGWQSAYDGREYKILTAVRRSGD